MSDILTKLRASLSEELPDKTAWDQRARAGELAAFHALMPVLKSALEGPDAAEALAVPLGAAVLACQMARALVPEGNMASLEDMLLATVRGAIRGGEHPVNEDGSAWQWRSLS